MSKSHGSLQYSRKVKVQDHVDDVELGLLLKAHQHPIIPTLWGIPIKYLSLVLLAVQNSGLTLIMHQSRVSVPPSQTYSAATAVLVNEILKGLVSFIIAFCRTDTWNDVHYVTRHQSFAQMVVHRLRRLRREIISHDSWKLSIPAILYVIQNNLQYVAVSNLQAATFQVTFQMKILTTAACSVLLLGKKLSSTQWLSLICLAIGVGIVQLQGGSQPSVPVSATDAMNSLKGFSAVIGACLTSGLAGVYFEMVLKNSQTDLWVRNIQLSLFSLLPALVTVLLMHRAPLFTTSIVFTLFSNFGVWAWATVCVQVLGGLITAIVIKYSDNIMKGFATSLSIVISFLVSVIMFDFQMTMTFILGSSIVLIATWLYSRPCQSSSSMWVNLATLDAKVHAAVSQEVCSPPYPQSSLSTVSSTTSVCSMTSSHSASVLSSDSR